MKYSEFIDDFFNNMSDLQKHIHNNQESNEKIFDKEKIIEDINLILEKGLEFHQINLSESDTNDLIQSIPSKWSTLLNDISINKNDFVDIFFLKKISLSNEDFEKSILPTIENSSDNQTSCFNFGYLLDDESINSSDLNNFIKDSFNTKNDAAKIEALANINIFLSSFSQTKEGQKYLKTNQDKISKNSSYEDKIDWVHGIINQYNKASVFKNLSFNDKTKKFDINAGQSGDFDGFFILKGDNNDFIIKQTQVSTTKDQGVEIEKSSVLRHQLSNTAIGIAVNNYMKHWLEDDHSKNFHQQYLNYEDVIQSLALEDEANVKRSDIELLFEYDLAVKDISLNLDVHQANKQNFLLDAINQHYGTQHDTLSTAIRDMNQNIDNYTEKAFSRKNEITAISIDQAIQDNSQYVKTESAFFSTTNQTAYKGEFYQNSTIKNDISEDINSQKFTMEELKLSTQLLGLSYYNSANLTLSHNKSRKLMNNNEVIKHFCNQLKQFGASTNNNIHVEKLQNKGLKEVEGLLFKHIVFADNREIVDNNLRAFGNLKQVNNVSFYFKSIFNNIKNEDDFLNKCNDIGITPTKSFEETLHILSQSVFFDEELHNTIKSKKENIKLKKENDIKILNIAISIQNKDILNDNEDLLKVYEHIEESNNENLYPLYDGKDKKIDIQNYEEILKEIEAKKNLNNQTFDYSHVDVDKSLSKHSSNKTTKKTYSTKNKKK